jgi:seryl-tRNA synthetase
VNLRRFTNYPQPKPNLPPISLDSDFLLNPDNIEIIRQNIKARNSDADIDTAHRLHADGSSEEQILAELVKCPNMSHTQVATLTEPKLCFQRDFIPPEHKIRSFDEIAKILGAARLQNLKNFCGDRTYFLSGVLANLEQALIHWAVQQLENKGFQLISVPDILHKDIIQRCGMNVDGDRTQVYKLGQEFGPAALSGTAEMAIGGFLMGKQIPKLPLKLCAVSRCYRAEASKNVHDKGLYRVHQFYKVEMFVVTDGNSDASQEALHQVLSIEREMFDGLGLAYRVLDMSPDELGDPAARKYDIEAWMPGRNFWGEISSCSDCTDYQARRLAITDSNGRFCYTVNGTACAVPRMIIALCEQHQTLNGSVNVPEVLRDYMGGAEVLQGKPKKLRPSLKYISSANFFENENVVID